MFSISGCTEILTYNNYYIVNVVDYQRAFGEDFLSLMHYFPQLLSSRDACYMGTILPFASQVVARLWSPVFALHKTWRTVVELIKYLRWTI